MSVNERPRWRVNQQSFIGHSLVEEGAEVFYAPTVDEKTGVTHGVSENLSPLNDAAQAIIDAQKRDHIDKTANRDRRVELAREAAEEAARGDLPDDKAAKDGPVTQPKGDRRTGKAAAPRRPAASTGAAEGDAGLA